jgi:Acyl-CoA reductase (LuxC)
VTERPEVPIVVRGELIDQGLIDHRRFLAPDLREHLDRVVLADPRGLEELEELSLDEIIDYLVELGEHLDLATNPYIQDALVRNAGGLYTEAILTTMFRAMPMMLQRDIIEEFIDCNIGRRYLEDWVSTELSDRTLHVRAFGARTVHVLAGNAPTIAMQTVLSNAVTRSDAIVKLPGNDPWSGVAIARTMIDMAPEHPLTRHVTFAYWRGGDEVVESRLYDPRHIEKIVAWGGYHSMRSIRKYLVPGLDLIALDPKLSASIIGRAAFESEAGFSAAARGAAADVGYFNQTGCVSARTLYVESGTDEAGIDRLNRFGGRVFAELQALPAAISSPHPSFAPDLRTDLAAVRDSDDYRVFGGYESEGAVIVSQSRQSVDFADRLDCRVANLVPIDRIEQALERLNTYTQTVGVYPDQLKHEIRGACAIRGAERIVSLGHATAAGLAGPHDAIEPLSRMVRWVRDDTQDHAGGLVMPPDVLSDLSGPDAGAVP